MSTPRVADGGRIRPDLSWTAIRRRQQRTYSGKRQDCNDQDTQWRDRVSFSSTPCPTGIPGRRLQRLGHGGSSDATRAKRRLVRYYADGEWYTDYAAFGIAWAPFGCNSVLVMPDSDLRGVPL
jgi:hypothetical protein